MGRLRRLDIPIVSLVGKPAIRREFLVVKSAGGDTDMAKNEQVTEESYLESLRGALDGETPDIARALEIVKSLEDAVEELDEDDGEGAEIVEKCSTSGSDYPQKPEPVQGSINLHLSVSQESIKFWQLMDAMATVSRNIVDAEGDIVAKSELVSKAAEDFTQAYTDYMSDEISGDSSIEKSEDGEDMEIDVDVSKAGRTFSARHKAEISGALKSVANLIGMDVVDIVAAIEDDDDDAGEANVQKGDDEATEEVVEGAESDEDEDLTDEDVQAVLEAVTGVTEVVKNMATKEDIDKLVQDAAGSGE